MPLNYFIYISSNAWIRFHTAQLILCSSLEIREIIVILIEDSVLSLAGTIIESGRCSFICSVIVFVCSLASAGVVIVNCTIRGRLMKVVSSCSRIELSWSVWIVCLWVIEVLIISELFFWILELIWWHKEWQELCLCSEQLLLLLRSKLLLLLWSHEALRQELRLKIG